jgi:hypothetical protein
MRLSRRSLFFLVVVGTVLLLLPATPGALRWVNLGMAALALFWFSLLAVEDLITQRRGERPPDGKAPR